MLATCFPPVPTVTNRKLCTHKEFVIIFFSLGNLVIFLSIKSQITQKVNWKHPLSLRMQYDKVSDTKMMDTK